MDWSDPAAVRALNTALLVADYGVDPRYAEMLPEGALCPPVPSRADYVHQIADLLRESLSEDGVGDGGTNGVPRGPSVVGMDVGTGASCIYPTIAAAVYGWRTIASEVDPRSVASARGIVGANGHGDLIDVRLQEAPDKIFDGILRGGETIDFAMCNPPIHASAEACRAENARKLRGLARGRRLRERPAGPPAATSNNFGGTATELWCDGGEVGFVKRIAAESRRHWDRCLWFTSLVSRRDHLAILERYLRGRSRRSGGRGVRTVRRSSLGAGKKGASILLWSFLDRGERREWAEIRGWG